VSSAAPSGRSSLVEPPGGALSLGRPHGPASAAEVVRSAYPPGLTLREHAHPQSGIQLVLAGSLRESWGGVSREVGPLGVVFKPAALPHANRYGPSGARCLIVGFDADCHPRLAVSPFVSGVSRLSVLVLEVGDAARRGSRSLDFKVDELASEIEDRGRAIRLPRPRGSAPRWLRMVEEAVAAGEITRLSEAAELAGVHPTYVARAARAHLGRSLGELVRERRLERAMVPLSRGRASIAALAQAAGFADQSHLGRACRRRLGTTPARLRRATLALSRL
jgi:AraC family transcriptional regulator